MTSLCLSSSSLFFFSSFLSPLRLTHTHTHTHTHAYTFSLYPSLIRPWTSSTCRDSFAEPPCRYSHLPFASLVFSVSRPIATSFHTHTMIRTHTRTLTHTHTHIHTAHTSQTKLHTCLRFLHTQNKRPFPPPPSPPSGGFVAFQGKEYDIVKDQQLTFFQAMRVAMLRPHRNCIGSSQ